MKEVETLRNEIANLQQMCLLHEEVIRELEEDREVILSQLQLHHQLLKDVRRHYDSAMRHLAG